MYVKLSNDPTWEERRRRRVHIFWRRARSLIRSRLRHLVRRGKIYRHWWCGCASLFLSLIFSRYGAALCCQAIWKVREGYEVLWERMTSANRRPTYIELYAARPLQGFVRSTISSHVCPSNIIPYTCVNTARWSRDIVDVNFTRGADRRCPLEEINLQWRRWQQFLLQIGRE